MKEKQRERKEGAAPVEGRASAIQVGADEAGLEILTRRQLHDMLHSGALNDRKRAGSGVEAGNLDVSPALRDNVPLTRKLET